SHLQKCPPWGSCRPRGPKHFCSRRHSSNPCTFSPTRSLSLSLSPSLSPSLTHSLSTLSSLRLTPTKTHRQSLFPSISLPPFLPALTSWAFLCLYLPSARLSL